PPWLVHGCWTCHVGLAQDDGALLPQTGHLCVAPCEVQHLVYCPKQQHRGMASLLTAVASLAGKLSTREMEPEAEENATNTFICMRHDHEQQAQAPAGQASRLTCC